MPPPPNILILYTDQQRWDALGASGNDEVHTPNLDALAAESTQFENCFVQHPLCMPSRASFHTGRYPSSLGITRMGVPLPESTQTMARHFGAAGYETANFGKLHFLPHANRDHRRPHPAYGFDRLLVSDEPGCYEDAYRAWVRRNFPDALDSVSCGLPPAAGDWNRIMGLEDPVAHPDERFPMHAVPFRGPDGATHSAFVADQTDAFLRRSPTEPFFCIAGFYSPHSPWIAPRKFLDLYAPEDLSIHSIPEGWNLPAGAERLPDDQLRSIVHGYYAMVSEVDHYVGALMDSLRETGALEHTIVVFTSDHGEWLGTRGKFGKGYPADESVAHVPLLVRFPEAMGLPAGRVDGLVESVDVLPTLLEACGLQVDPEIQGRSLLPEARGEGRGKESVLTEAAGWKSLRTKEWHYLLHADGSEALFDVRVDPGGYVDCAADASVETLAQLRHQLATRMLDAERPIPRTWPY